MSSRTAAVALLAAMAALPACDRQQSLIPTAPSTSQLAVPFRDGLAPGTWTGDATVLSARGTQACGWGTKTGDARSGVLWHVAIVGESIFLTEDIVNAPLDHLPFSGTLNGLQFTATYSQAGSGVCPFTGATLTGTLSTDGLSFEALETLTWGVDTIVQRRWIVVLPQ